MQMLPVTNYRTLRWFALALLGALSATGFAPLFLWPLTLIAFAIWMEAVRRAETLQSALAQGWWFGVGHFIMSNNWIATAFQYQDKLPPALGWVAVTLLAFFLGIYPMIAATLAWRAGRSHDRTFVLVFAAGWIATEWLRATMFTGYAWNPLGVMWTSQLGVARLAAWTGTYGLSGLTIVIAGALLWIARRNFFTGGCVIALTSLVALYPLPAAMLGGPNMKIVQPNIGQQDKYNPALEARNYELLATLTGPLQQSPRLILWPEAAIPAYLEEEEDWRRRLASLLGPRDILMTGGLAIVWQHRKQSDQRQAIAARNSLFILSPAARILGRYDKAHLVPFGEYLPMRSILSTIGLSRLAPGDLDFLPGLGPQTFEVPGFSKVGAVICYEIIFSGHVVDKANRPKILVNPSNDAWFGPSGPPQHLAQAQLRAIEEGLPIVRGTPTGISAAIDPYGRLIAVIGQNVMGAKQISMPAALPPTPFAQYGNLLPLLVALLLLVAAKIAWASRSESSPDM